MKRILINLVAMVAAAAAGPVLAQVTYPTTASGVRAPGTVPLQCDANGANCAPKTGANPEPVAGTVASGTADSGNPVKVGGVFRSTMPTLTDGQRGDLQLDNRAGLLVSIKGTGTTAANVGTALDATSGTPGLFVTPLGLVFNGSTWDRMRGDVNGQVVQPALSATFWQYAAASGGIVSSTADVAVKTAAGAGVRNYVCGIDIAHDALGGATELVIKDGASVMWRGRLQTAAVDSSNGSGAIVFSPCLRGSANTAVNVAAISSVTGGIYVNLRGYTGG